MIETLLIQLINAYSIIIFIYVLMSWFPHEQGIVGQIYSALGVLCDWYLDLFRRFIPPIGGALDISPIVALLVLQLVGRLIAIIL